MTESDYPALYRSAEAASAFTQKGHLSLLAVQSVLLAIGATIAMLPTESATVAIISASIFLVSLALTIYSRTQHFQRNWYQSRALAESIKTTSWRYMMGAEPFDVDETTSGIVFRDLLGQLLSDNRSLGDYFAETPAADEQLTARMQEIRRLSLAEKIAFYRQNRVVDQRQWYSAKASSNRARGRFWFSVLIIAYLFAVTCALIKIAVPQFKFYPSGVLAVVASGVLTWMQAKRYSEIAAAYVLTAHEIGILEHGLQSVNTQPEFSKFVGDAESAFSREHTQWAARRRE